jgi:5'-nucleotidase
VPHRSTLACLAVVGLLTAACSSDGDDAAATTTVGPAETTTTAAAEPLTILVTNDDGIGAPGIDEVVNALQEMEAVEVVIVAPAENQSGSSDTTTDGPVTHEPATTASGDEGTAVDGFPADTIGVALDELGVEPDLVVSGVNEGQNVGPLAAVSGTVGAAREAIRRGVPAVAGSAGQNETAYFDIGADLIVEWITEHRAALLAGDADTTMVTSFNVPGCTIGDPQEVLDVPLGTVIPDGVNIFLTPDCSIEPATPPTDDVTALIAGHSAVTQVPAEL